jgi:hypothetical protein
MESIPYYMEKIMLFNLHGINSRNENNQCNTGEEINQLPYNY